MSKKVQGWKTTHGADQNAATEEAFAQQSDGAGGTRGLESCSVYVCVGLGAKTPTQVLKAETE